MQERQQERPREVSERANEKITIKWRPGGRQTSECSERRGIKMSEFLKKHGHENLLRKTLFRKDKRVAIDKNGKLVQDDELQDGDVLILYEGEIIKGEI